jgi:hypothetical protein
MGLGRRALLESLLPVGVLTLLLRRDALAAAARSEARKFLRGVDAASRGLQERALRPAEWQRRVEELARAVDLDDLRRAADFERVARTLALPDDNAGSVAVRFPELRLRFAAKIFGLDRGRAITPHGHRNMVSMHLVLRGRIHARHFDRVRDERDEEDGRRTGLSKPGGHLILRPTLDKVFREGDASSISSERDNVHWFVAQGAPAYTFDCVLSGLEPLGFDYGIDLVDPVGAERLPDGTLRAPIISWGESLRRYGKVPA